MSILQTAVVGVGGVGGYFGGKLCQLQNQGIGVGISFIARGQHLRAIQESGLVLISEDEGERVCRPCLATDDFRALPPLDLCLICVKEFDLADVLTRLKPLVSRQTVLLPLLNGVDIHARVRSVISEGIVLPACVYVGTHIEGPGRVVQKGGARRILFGPDPTRPDFVPDRLMELFGRAGIRREWSLNIEAEIWTKFVFICGYGLVSADSGKTLGEIFGDDRLKGQVRGVMNEVAALARGCGVQLPTEIVELSLQKAGGFPGSAKTSFQRDFERMDRRDERDLFCGSILRLADRQRIDAPGIRAISEALAARKPAPLSR